MEKKIKILGDIEVGGERGRIVWCGGVASALTGTEYKDPQKTIKHLTRNRYENDTLGASKQASKQASSIIVLGGLGVSARRDRDPDRVLHRKGIVYALPAHISADKPLVVRKYK